MKFRLLGLAAAFAAIAPAVCTASPEQDALNACAHAFASSLAAPGSAAPAYKVAYMGSEYTGSMLAFYAREFTFDMHANNLKTGLPIARASCSVDSHGTIIALSPVPLNAARAGMAARL